MNSDQSYWLVGASWDGVDHQDKKFVDNKIWVWATKKKDDESQYLKAKKIKKGDRIAIKRMMGKRLSQHKNTPHRNSGRSSRLWLIGHLRSQLASTRKEH